jgi:hypothetical protein
MTAVRPHDPAPPVGVSTDGSASISKHPPRATQNATRALPEALPADPDLAAVVEAWNRLPESVRASILMLVKAAVEQ